MACCIHPSKTIHGMEKAPLILKALFASVPCLQGLPAEVVDDVARHISERSVEGGEFLFNEGDEGDALYLVHQGRVRILKNAPDGGVFEVAEIGRGGVIGEMALLSNMPRSAHALAIRDTVLWRLDKQHFFDLVHRYPALMVCVARTIVDRAVNAISGKKHVASLSTIALVNLLPQDRSAAFSRHFAAGLEKLHPTALITSDADAVRGCLHGAEDVRRCIADRLNNLEESSRYLVLESGPGETEWLQACLRQADKVLLCCGPDHLPRGLDAVLDEIREVAANVQKPVEVLVCHPADVVLGRSAPDTKDAFRQFPRYNLRWNNPEDYERVARIVTGQGTAVVLGGGGARGMAHVGVLRALDEAGVDVDLVGGTSIGAIVGAGYAHGWSFEDLMEKFREQVSSRWSLLDFAVPRYALFRGQKLDRVLERVFGDVATEELWRPFFCVSTDYRTARQRVHSRGRLTEVVRASVSLPGIFPMVQSDGSHLLDGGVVNNLPADVMRQMTPNGKVIAIDVGGGDGGEDTIHKAPSILETMTRTAIMSSQRRYERMIASGIIDTIIRPEVAEFGLMDFRALEALVERGYRAGVAAIEQGGLDGPGTPSPPDSPVPETGV